MTRILIVIAIFIVALVVLFGLLMGLYSTPGPEPPEPASTVQEPIETTQEKQVSPGPIGPENILPKTGGA